MDAFEQQLKEYGISLPVDTAFFYDGKGRIYFPGRYPKTRKTSIIKRMIARFNYIIFNTWLGFLLIILFFQTLGCLLAGAS